MARWLASRRLVDMRAVRTADRALGGEFGGHAKAILDAGRSRDSNQRVEASPICRDRFDTSIQPLQTRDAENFRENFSRRNFEIFASRQSSRFGLWPSQPIRIALKFSKFRKTFDREILRKFCMLAAIFGNPVGIVAGRVDKLSNRDNTRFS